MVEFLLSPENTPFSVALALMFGIAILEGVLTVLGFGFSNALDSLVPDFDVDMDLDMDLSIETDIDHGVAPDLDSNSALSRLFSWLRVGKVPVLMLFIVFLTGFGLSGLAMQSFFQSMTGHLLPAIVISVPAFLVSLPIVRMFGGVLNRIMPKDETDAVSENSLIGRIATITLGKASIGSPAEAKVRDIHGTTHYVMVEPDIADTEFSAGNSVLLVKKDDAVFKVIENPNPALVD